MTPRTMETEISIYQLEVGLTGWLDTSDLVMLRQHVPCPCDDFDPVRQAMADLAEDGRYVDPEGYETFGRMD